MRVVVTGATGNVGTSLLTHLSADPEIDSIVGVARRLPDGWNPGKVEWTQADVTESDLEFIFQGADAVVHLAWLIQPSRDERTLEAVNVGGSERVFRAAAAAGVSNLVYASSVGAYSPGPKDQAVDESHPTGGIPTSFYARHKAAVESLLDTVERENPRMTVARLRPGLIFKRDAATGIRRYFAGPLLPGSLVRRELIPLVPAIDRLRFQAVHSLDVGRAYQLVIKQRARGAFNVAADPVLDPDRLGEILGARPVKLPTAALRWGAFATWKLRLQPTPPGWLDMALAVPIMDTSRVRNELGWEPQHTSGEALLELLEGMHEGAGFPTPPLDPGESGPARVREALTGVGGRSF